VFFRKSSSEPRPTIERSSSDSVTGSQQVIPISGHPSLVRDDVSDQTGPSNFDAARGDDVGLGLVLDALGGVLGALSRFPIDLPDKPADESSRELAAWQKHATLGFPIDSSVEGGALGVGERDWDGIVRAVTSQRRDEHLFVESSINELREALWACVETVHKAVAIDQTTDSTTAQQMERAKNALKRMQTGTIKQEVLGAVSSIEGALQSRRDQQQEQYVSLASKLDRLGRQLEEARRENTTDPLTGIGNRKLFDMMAPRAIQMHSLSKQPVVLLMIDLDKLKLVNDMYGHQAGDAAIATLGTALAKVFLRQSDVLCRYGGDEFAAILHNTDWKTAQTLARRLQEQIASMPSPHPSMEFQIGASVGVAQLDQYEDCVAWIARADKALYNAKKSGRDRVCIAESLIKSA